LLYKYPHLSSFLENSVLIIKLCTYCES
ncbi:hypothetical protein TGAM01_v210597, partial [Trichoderma gamsii]